ncbi:MAG: ankyrin repeat domain-containing protein [Bacteroidia bacterium]|nr:ankyrin repeat domain-containing protein [Bacteroidia bacterium]
MSLDLTQAIVRVAGDGRPEDRARMLLQHGASPDNPDTRQFYPLQLAASHGCMKKWHLFCSQIYSRK